MSLASHGAILDCENLILDADLILVCAFACYNASHDNYILAVVLFMIVILFARNCLDVLQALLLSVLIVAEYVASTSAVGFNATVITHSSCWRFAPNSVSPSFVLCSLRC